MRDKSEKLKKAEQFWKNLTLGERVSLLRQQKGWSQKDLAEKSRITQATISRIESGHVKELKCHAFQRLAHTLSISMDYLLLGLSE